MCRVLCDTIIARSARFHIKLGHYRNLLPIDLHRELKLPRIVGSRRLAGVGVKLVDGGDVESVGEVEDVGDQVHVDAFSEINPAGYAHVVEHRPRSHAGVAPQGAVETKQGDLRRQRCGRRRKKGSEAHFLQIPGG